MKLTGGVSDLMTMGEKVKLNSMYGMIASQTYVVRCKNCKHRPHDKRGHGVSEDLVFPDDVCPLQCDDPWYSKYPEDDFFCAKGESNNGKD